MGILDDAIREHLELIRRHGATDSEVARLEDEAFGPPTRPDEPDFAGDAHAAGNGNGVATEAAVEEAGPEEAAAHEDVTTLLPTEGSEEGSEAGTGLEEPTGAHVSANPPDEPVRLLAMSAGSFPDVVAYPEDGYAWVATRDPDPDLLAKGGDPGIIARFEIPIE